MNALCWIPGEATVLVGGGFLSPTLPGNALRHSSGAAEHGPLFIGLPVPGLALLLAPILPLFNKPTLHPAAVSAPGLIGFCPRHFHGAGEAPLSLAIAYLVARFVGHSLAAWRVVPQS